MSLNRLLTRRVRRAALALSAAAVLAACGGGNRAEPYVPTSLQVYGDELSLIDDSVSVSATNASGIVSSSAKGNGVKYTVNGFNSTTGLLDCEANPIWVQYLASNLGMAFKECAGTKSVFAANNNAAVGETTQNVIDKLTLLRAGNPGPSTLVTVLVGIYDVKSLYEQVRAGALSLDAAKTAATQLGAALAAEVTRVTEAKIGIIVSSIPDIGYSPYAAALGADAVAALHQLTFAFNKELFAKIPSNGHHVGWVYGIPQGFTTSNSNQGDYTVLSGIANANTAVCASGAPVTQCTTTTLVTGGDITTWIWAGDIYPTPMTHTKLGNLAVSKLISLAPGS